EATQNRSLLNVTIQTGRKHQIRKHLASAGHPVVGDRLYGLENEPENLQLTAYSLTFDCPISHQSQTYQLPAIYLPVL
ncbi:MAG: RNA pseudouridine synthase, partial [Candidatus Latescibacteria bacterium]|nr:RNA pseudouridine synthase [Candidatus Latescibacterota bacterium]